MIPTLVVAAPASGSGKTTVTCALAAALRARGMDVRTFKAGPDYLDPTWHRAVTGRPSRNLDGWMMGYEGVRDAFARGAAGGDLAIVEGVMGLFDGRDPRTFEGSAAELAIWLDAPVLVVVDASAMARTAAAVVEGLARHHPDVHVAGVVFNRAPHRDLLAAAMEAVGGVASCGALPLDPALAVPERHLGLHPGEGAPPSWVDSVAAWAAAHVDLDRVVALARPVPASSLVPPRAPVRARIGVARDEALFFYYDDNLERLEEAGAELVRFSPLADATLPPDLDGLYLGGGYPEVHADRLVANAGMLAALRAFGGPIYAECGGLMLLGEAIDGRPTAGMLPVRTRMTTRPTIGYREVVTTRPTLFGPAGTRFRGHEFHYAEVEPAGPPLDLLDAYAGGPGWTRGRVLASWVHACFASNPSMAAAFVDECLRRS